MKQLIQQVNQLKKTKVKSRINKRLKQFESFKNKSTKKWFSELCFCILTANSKAKTALNIQKELEIDGFCSHCVEDISRCIRNNKHRFHNNKAKYIVEARDHIDIKKKIQTLVQNDSQKSAREWLVKNIKGLGYKEASHFMRNVGYFDLAILDRHILNLMAENKMINKPKSLTKKNYLEIESKLGKFAQKLKMSQGELDMYLWHMKTGEVLK